jgi:hypothetical protein
MSSRMLTTELTSLLGNRISSRLFNFARERGSTWLVDYWQADAVPPPLELSFKVDRSTRVVAAEIIPIGGSFYRLPW